MKSRGGEGRPAGCQDPCAAGAPAGPPGLSRQAPRLEAALSLTPWGGTDREKLAVIFLAAVAQPEGIMSEQENSVWAPAVFEVGPPFPGQALITHRRPRPLLPPPAQASQQCPCSCCCLPGSWGCQGGWPSVRAPRLPISRAACEEVEKPGA